MPAGTTAKKVAKVVKKGSHQAKKAKVWTNTTFKMPISTTQKRSPKNPLRAVSKNYVSNLLDVIRQPVATESVTRMNIVEQNTVVFLVKKQANKKTIRTAVQHLYKVQVKKVNTLITPKGDKKAYVKLVGDSAATELANKIGAI
jgi:large subunit ribosomal protein L23Ae